MMIQKLVQALRRAPFPVPTIPDGYRLYAIGDVHGRLDLLDRLLAMIEADDAARGSVPDTMIVFLGDLVDRGPDSAGVVERLSALAPSRPGVRFVMGNHEEVFLGALTGNEERLRLFCRIGGRETLLSYGMSPEEYESLEYDAVAVRMRELVPAAHIAFLEGFEDVVTLGDYVFVHAGIRPGRALADQEQTDLRWIRDTFLNDRDPFEKRVVHGHTITEEVDYRPNRIGIDTGAYLTGKLTALGLQGNQVWDLQT